MDQTILESIGLTKSEVKVYLALLELGSSSSGAIVEVSGVASSKVYELLDKLIQKGLVSTVIKRGVKYYEAATPKRILEYLTEKENKLKAQIEDVKTILPRLELKQKLSKEVSEISVYKSMKGIETTFTIILNSVKRGDEYYILGARSGATEAQRLFLLKYHKKRIAKGVKLKLLFSRDIRNITKPYEQMELTEVKYMDPGLMSPTQITMVKDIAIIYLWKEKPIAILIENKEMADSFKKYFWFLWNYKQNM